MEVQKMGMNGAYRIGNMFHVNIEDISSWFDNIFNQKMIRLDVTTHLCYI